MTLTDLFGVKEMQGKVARRMVIEGSVGGKSAKEEVGSRRGKKEGERSRRMRMKARMKAI